MTSKQFTKIRKRLFRTQAAAAEAMGVCQGTVSLYESGGRPVPKTIIKLLDCLKKQAEQ